MSTAIELPQKADILLAEILGTMMNGESVSHYFEDAMERLCRDDAICIPSRGIQYATLIESEALRSVTEVQTSKYHLEEFNRFRDSASVLKSKNFGATLNLMGFEEVTFPTRFKHV